MSERHEQEQLLEFPCHYPFKAVGEAGEGFYRSVVAAVSRSVPVAADAVKSRPSSRGNYQSVTVMVTLHNFDQLKTIYADLRQVPGMKMLL